jgi:hypothetical protein
MAEKRQGIVTQLRNFGDNKNIVPCSNNTKVYINLKDSDRLIKLVQYKHQQGGKITTVGVDLYFPKEHRKWLEENIG